MPWSRRQPARPRLNLQPLEDRVVPASVVWDATHAPNGGDWADPSNWLPNAPATGDDVVIAGLNSGAIITHNSGNDSIGSLSLGADLNLYGGSVTVSGILTIQAAHTITDQAILNLTTDSSVSFQYAYNTTTQLIVGSTGLLSATGSILTAASDGNFTQIYVDTGGRLIASDCTFSLSQVYLKDGANFIPGDLSGNKFLQPLWLPYGDVKFLSAASGGSDNKSFQNIDILAGSIPSGQSLALNAIGTDSHVQRFVFPANFTVSSGGSMSVAAGVQVEIRPGVTLYDYGLISLGTGAGVAFDYAYNTTTQIIVGNPGVLQATGSSFIEGYTDNFTQIYLDSGGRLIASDCTFDLSQVYFQDGSIFNSGDLAGNTFLKPLWLPYADVKYLSAAGGGSDNKSFQDIDILAGTVPNGQTLALNAIGTVSPPKQYVFPATFTVGNGGTMSVAANVNVLLRANVTLYDYGSVYVNTHATVNFEYAYNTTTQIIVGSPGLLQATGSTFSAGYTDNFTQIYVSSGGHLVANNCTFNAPLDQVYLDNGAIFNPGDLSGNGFTCPLYLPYGDVALLSAPVGSDNKSFQDIYVLPSTLPSGKTLALNAIGTVTPPRQYVFPGNFTIAAGATLSVGPSVKVVLQPNVTLNDNGMTSFATGASVYLPYAYGTSTQIVVGGTGALTATGTTFSADNSSQLYVSPGGHLIANGCTFGLSSLTLADGSILNRGDITGSTFNQTIYIPAADAALLIDNLRFNEVDILAGNLVSGQTAGLVPLGTSGNQDYVLTGNLVVQAGATLNISSGAAVVAAESNSTPFGIYVNGSMNVTGAFLTHTGAKGSSTLQVNLGGQLTATASTLDWSNLNLTSGSTGNFQFLSVASQFTIAGDATTDIALNNFSGVGANGVIAVGDPAKSIDLRNNYWGSNLSDSDVAAKILDYADSPVGTRPTIQYDPFLNNPPTQFFNPASMPTARAGAGYNQTITGIGGAATNFTLAKGALPDGVTLSAGGVLAGTPTVVGSFIFTVSADIASSTVSQIYWLAVDPPIITFTPAALSATMANVNYNQALTAGGGTAPYSNFTVLAGALPDGLSLSPDGVISGIPTVEGNFVFAVNAQDSTTGANVPYSGTQIYSLSVDSTPPTTGSVNDGVAADIEFQPSASTIAANWAGFIENGSGIAEYEWAIGTALGFADVRPFTSVGNVTHASATGLVLNDAGTYFVSVKAIDNAGNVSSTATSDGVAVDTTKPATGVVNDGVGADIEFQVSPTTISGNWSGFADFGSGIANYKWAIGTSPGYIDVLDFTDVGLATSATDATLSLSRGTIYYVSVEAIDNVGNISNVAISDGVAVLPPPPTIDAFSTDSGVVGDGITNDKTPTLSGTAEVGSLVKVFDGLNAMGTTYADGSGAWELTTLVLPDGDHNFTATATDGDNNTSPPSAPMAVTIDTAGPTVTIEQAAGQAETTNASPITFTVHFSEPVTDLTPADIALTGTLGGSLVAGLSGAGRDYTVTVTGMSGTGTVVASIPAGAAFDAAGNGSLVSTSLDNTVTFDNDPPTVTIEQAVTQPDPTYQSPITFAVSFSEPVTGFTSAGIDLTGSTVGGTLLADVSGSGTDYTVTVTGMVGFGNVVASIAAGAAVDAANNGNLASSSSDNQVYFSSVGALQFGGAVYHVTEEEGSVDITVERIHGSTGAVSVHYETSDGTATSPDDYSQSSDTLYWGAGDATPQTIPITISADLLSEGKESFTLTLSMAGGNADLGPQATATVIIAASNGVTIAATDKSPIATTTDSDGDLETLRLSGKLGSMTYYLTNGAGPFSEIDLEGTDSTRSVLSIAVKKPKGGTGDGRVELGEIDGTGVKVLSLAKADLIGAGINLSGFLGSLSIGAIENGADITLSGAPPKPTLSTRITAGVIGDGTDITISDAPLGKLTATSVGIGTIGAPSVGAISIKGKGKTRTTPAIPGDFKSDLSIAGIGLTGKTPALRSFYAAGTVSDSTISVGSGAGTVGDVGSFTVGSFVNSHLFAGYSGPDDGSGAFNTGTVRSFTVRAKTDGFARSFVVAANFIKVLLISVEPDNSLNKFGFVYDGSMKSLMVRSTKFKFDPMGGDVQDQPDSDFEIKKVTEPATAAA